MPDPAPTRFRMRAARRPPALPGLARRSLVVLHVAAALGMALATVPAAWAQPAAAVSSGPSSPLTAAQELQRDAEAGSLVAMVRLADSYRDGSSGQVRNLALALQWYVKAAERDNVGSMTEAAWGHLQGWSGQRNETEAARWYRRAAEKGDATGAYWLSEFHRQGWGGVEKNPAEMLRWLRAAAGGGHAGAMRDLGAAFEQGQGVAADRTQALNWYRQAAAAGLDVNADLARLGVRPAATTAATATVAAGGGGAAPPSPPARNPDSVAGTYTCRVSGEVDRTNGYGQRTGDFADATLTVTVAEDRSATFTFTRPPYRGSFRRNGGSYEWQDEWTSSSGNERRRTRIGFQLSGLSASGSRNERTFWRQVGSSQLRGSWAYDWTWDGRCRRSKD